LHHIRSRLTNFARNVWVFRKIIISWIILISLLELGLHFHLDAKIIGIVLVVVGFFTQAFSGLLAIIGFIPFIGPLIVKVLTLPIFWIINGIGYLASIVAIKKGHGMEVITYRILTIVFLIGIIFGYVLGRLLH